MARQYQSPDGSYVNETGTLQYQGPEAAFVNETVAASGAPKITPEELYQGAMCNLGSGLGGAQ